MKDQKEEPEIRIKRKIKSVGNACHPDISALFSLLFSEYLRQKKMLKELEIRQEALHQNLMEFIKKEYGL